MMSEICRSDEGTNRMPGAGIDPVLSLELGNFYWTKKVIVKSPDFCLSIVTLTSTYQAVIPAVQKVGAISNKSR
jgi:hypothetical protein